MSREFPLSRQSEPRRESLLNLETIFTEADKEILARGIIRLYEALDKETNLPTIIVFPDITGRLLISALEPMLKKIYRKKGQQMPTITTVATYRTISSSTTSPRKFYFFLTNEFSRKDRASLAESQLGCEEILRLKDAYDQGKKLTESELKPLHQSLRQRYEEELRKIIKTMASKIKVRGNSALIIDDYVSDRHSVEPIERILKGQGFTKVGLFAFVSDEVGNDLWGTWALVGNMERDLVSSVGFNFANYKSALTNRRKIMPQATSVQIKRTEHPIKRKFERAITQLGETVAKHLA